MGRQDGQYKAPSQEGVAMCVRKGNQFHEGCRTWMRVRGQTGKVAKSHLANFEGLAR